MLQLPTSPWDLPQGEPWGYAFAQALLKAPWGLRALDPAPGLLDLLGAELLRLHGELQRRRAESPLGPLGHRPPHPAEEGALRALLAKDPKALVQVFQSHEPWPFALYRAFRFDGRVHPLPSFRPPPEELVGYEAQRQALLANARRFLAGRPGLHTLLYGARGTGKSTLAKGLFGLEGAHLIQVEAQALPRLGELLEGLAPLPKRFFLLLDDLTLDPEGEAFHPLKALLEGSLGGPPGNVLLIATSNYRHLVPKKGANPLPGQT